MTAAVDRPRCRRGRGPGSRAGALALLLGATSLAFAGAAAEVEAARGDDDPGAGLYLLGRGAEALLAGGTVRLPAARFPCVRCHGADALGGGEGGTVVPPLAWSRLGVADDARGAYDRESFARAVRDGVAANGRTLAATMPRYRVDDESLDALLGYLRRIDREQRRGVDATTIRLLAPADAERRAGVAAAVADFNRRGGAYGREVRLVDEGAYLVAVDDVTPSLRALTRHHVLARLRELAAADGHDDLRALSGAGPEAAAPLLIDVEPEAERLRGLTERTVYAWIRDAGPHLRALLEGRNALVLLDTDADASRWALRAGLGGTGAAARADGSLLLAALLASGRDVTRARVLGHLARFDPDAAHERVLRTEAR